MSNLTLNQKEEKLKQLRDSIASLNTQIKPLVEEVIKLDKEVNNEKFQALLPLTLEKLFSAPMTVVETEQGFKESQTLMRNYPFVYLTGHNLITKTKWVDVTFDQTQDFDKQQKCVLEVLKCLPYQDNKAFEKVKDLTHPTKFKLCGVFHQETQFDGIFTLMVDESNNAFLINTRHSHQSCVTTGSLEAVLKYVYDNHPYKTNEDESSENED